MFICNFSQLNTSSCANKLCINKSYGYSPGERNREWQVGLHGQDSPVAKLSFLIKPLCWSNSMITIVICQCRLNSCNCFVAVFSSLFLYNNFGNCVGKCFCADSKTRLQMKASWIYSSGDSKKKMACFQTICHT